LSYLDKNMGFRRGGGVKLPHPPAYSGFQAGIGLTLWQMNN